MNRIDLGGHSGCGIFLVENDDGTVFVRKISKNSEYNKRLEAQCRKQAAFHGDKIKTPKILNTGVNENGLFYFDMEYIQGITLAEYIRNMEIGRIHGLVDDLMSYIENVDKKDCRNNANEVFSIKLNDLHHKLAGKSEIVDHALDLLINHDWSAFQPSSCHGDLTLENIIVRNEELYFIDFLDSFYDSYLMDMGTLMQDIQTMWSYRKDKKTDMNLILRLIVCRDLLLDAIREKDSSLVQEVYFSLLQKLIRILPYTTDEKTYSFLQEKIAIVSQEVE